MILYIKTAGEQKDMIKDETAIPQWLDCVG
jgi:hypothetical protein